MTKTATEKNINIFDLNDLSDLPKDMAQKIKLNGFSKETLQMLSLFKIKNSLTLDEILVGLYRLHNLKKTRSWVSSTLYNMKRRNLIVKNNEFYSLTEANNE